MMKRKAVFLFCVSLALLPSGSHSRPFLTHQTCLWFMDPALDQPVLCLLLTRYTFVGKGTLVITHSYAQSLHEGILGNLSVGYLTKQRKFNVAGLRLGIAASSLSLFLYH